MADVVTLIDGFVLCISAEVKEVSGCVSPPSATSRLPLLTLFRKHSWSSCPCP
jgi:hypothetical protein